MALPFAIRSLADDVWAKPQALSPFLFKKIETYSIKAEGTVKIDQVRPWFKNLWGRAEIDDDKMHSDHFDDNPF